MLDHVSIAVRDYPASKAFYTSVLATLNCKLQMEIPGHEVCGFGPKEHAEPPFWIASCCASSDGSAKAPTDAGPLGKLVNTHVGFSAPSRAVVDAFYKAAIDAGAQDNGAPGVRTMYHPNYYAAFVRDPDGYNIEIVCHLPPA